jgi:N6-adenosine-specific RNA methylase IME4
MKLIRYDAALRALAEATRVDEVKKIGDKATAVGEYARRAKDKALLTDCTLIKARAQIRGGELLIEMAERGERETKGGDRKSKSHRAILIPKLTDFGITLSESSRWQRLANLSSAEQDERIARALRRAIATVDGTGKKTREELRAEDEARILGLTPVEGKFHTLVIDPPWDYEWLSVGGASKPGYATMTHEQLLALDIDQWAREELHVYLWTTNNFMCRACELMQRWKVDYKTIITWIKTDGRGKPKVGLGTYFRNTTEHILFGIRGQLRTRLGDTPTHFFAPVGKHSEKPEAFYEIVRTESYLPAGELFQRKERAGFVNLFASTEMTEAAE